ncbi:uncharacterized protein LOC126267187 [Schistocerca gregaria]|uniref:uncharacterized protein LOC126267187 n=1 Tax=Schistocerca gregaria TaxID=7010 RepID=UPI00211F1968|nr:uncharacterized protein LOC126267187 [Schistocerca gregaria]
MELLTGVKIAFLLLSAAYASPDVTNVPTSYIFNPQVVCTAPAKVICSTDCKQVMVCLGNTTGGYTPSVVATCPTTGSTRCSAEQAACVAQEDSECHPPVAASRFPCNSVGSFPDPYDCQTYHICTAAGGVSQTATCSGTTAYNPLRADCSLSTSYLVCTRGPIKPCSQLGQVGVVPENQAIYYICTQNGDEIFPEMYRCTGNEIFDITVAACVDQSTTLKKMQP